MKKNRVNIVIAMLISVMFTISCGVLRSDKMSGRVGFKHDTNITESKDSLEYELIIIDSRFDSWFLRNDYMRGQYGDTYLKNMNSIYANSWNRLYMTGDRRVESYIDYNVQIDYGFEFNYKLFMYFRFFEEVNRVDLRTGIRR